jgi:hypothetical protein
MFMRGYVDETLIQARYTRNRQKLLEQANLTLEILRFQMRLAKDLQCLKVHSYAFASKAIDSPHRGRNRPAPGNVRGTRPRLTSEP